MKYAQTSALGTPEVLKRKLGGELITPITVDDSAFTNGICPAGTVLAADGKESSGDGSDCFGILINDVYSDNPNGSVIRAYATINTANTTATSSDRAAMPNLVFE